MVDNWLPNFDMDDQRARIPEKKIGENLERIRADVATRRRWIEPVTDGDRAAHEQFMSRGLCFEPAMLGGFLTVDSEKCVGCGACAKVCPAGCIALEGGKAVRNAQAGFGCNACLACMQRKFPPPAFLRKRLLLPLHRHHLRGGRQESRGALPQRARDPCRAARGQQRPLMRFSPCRKSAASA